MLNIVFLLIVSWAFICDQTFPNICVLSDSSRAIDIMQHLRNNLKKPKFIGHIYLRGWTAKKRGGRRRGAR